MTTRLQRDCATTVHEKKWCAVVYCLQSQFRGSVVATEVKRQLSFSWEKQRRKARPSVVSKRQPQRSPLAPSCQAPKCSRSALKSKQKTSPTHYLAIQECAEIVDSNGGSCLSLRECQHHQNSDQVPQKTHDTLECSLDRHHTSAGHRKIVRNETPEDRTRP